MGVGLFAFAGHIPGVVLRNLWFLAIAMTTLAIWFTDDATTAYAFFYLWPNLYAFYFLSRAEVAATIGFSGRDLRGGDRHPRHPRGGCGRQRGPLPRDAHRGPSWSPAPRSSTCAAASSA